MRETTCSNGHIYDSDLYDSCPYCNGNNRTISFEGDEYSFDYYQPYDRAGVGKTRMNDEFGYDTPISGVGKTRLNEDWEDVQQHSRSGADNYDGRTVAPRGFYDVEERIKTVAPRGFVCREKDNKTVVPEEFYHSNREHSKTENSFSPVPSRTGEALAGWLVCIDGPERGNDYRVFCRVNTIGRSKSMDIQINDPGVSYDKNARLTYDTRNNEFCLLPAEDCNNVYLNGRLVLVPTQLNAFDQIDFGECRMLFVPLCGERFCWQDSKRMRDDR